MATSASTHSAARRSSSTSTASPTPESCRSRIGARTHACRARRRHRDGRRRAGVAAVHACIGADRRRRADRATGRRDHRPAAGAGGEDRQLRRGPTAMGSRPGRRRARGQRRRGQSVRRPVPERPPAPARSCAVGPHRRPRPADGDEPSGVRLLGRQPGCHAVDRGRGGIRSARRLRAPSTRLATAARPTALGHTTCCSIRHVRAGDRDRASPAQPLWSIDPAWTPPSSTQPAPTPRHGADRQRPRRVDMGCGERHLPAVAGRRNRTSPCQVRASRLPMSVELATSYVPSPVDARSPTRSPAGQASPWCHRDGIAIPATWSTPRPTTSSSPANGERPADPLDTGNTFLEDWSAPADRDRRE